MSYVLIFSFLFYAFIMKMFNDINLFFGAALVVFVPFAMQMMIDITLATSYGVGIDSVLTFSNLALVVFQLLAAVLLFWVIKRSDDDLVMWGFYVGIGALILYLTIPNVVRLFLGM